jgi:hypothetical protein
MVEAENIAWQFVHEKKPAAMISVQNAELRSANRWTIIGVALERSELGGSTTDWRVEIENENVVAFTFAEDRGHRVP